MVGADGRREARAHAHDGTPASTTSTTRPIATPPSTIAFVEPGQRAVTSEAGDGHGASLGARRGDPLHGQLAQLARATTIRPPCGSSSRSGSPAGRDRRAWAAEAQGQCLLAVVIRWAPRPRRRPCSSGRPGGTGRAAGTRGRGRRLGDVLRRLVDRDDRRRGRRRRDRGCDHRDRIAPQLGLLQPDGHADARDPGELMLDVGAQLVGTGPLPRLLLQRTGHRACGGDCPGCRRSTGRTRASGRVRSCRPAARSARSGSAAGDGRPRRRGIPSRSTAPSGASPRGGSVADLHVGRELLIEPADGRLDELLPAPQAVIFDLGGLANRPKETGSERDRLDRRRHHAEFLSAACASARRSRGTSTRPRTTRAEMDLASSSRATRPASSAVKRYPSKPGWSPPASPVGRRDSRRPGSPSGAAPAGGAVPAAPLARASAGGCPPRREAGPAPSRVGRERRSALSGLRLPGRDRDGAAAGPSYGASAPRADLASLRRPHRILRRRVLSTFRADCQLRTPPGRRHSRTSGGRPRRAGDSRETATEAEWKGIRTQGGCRADRADLEPGPDHPLLRSPTRARRAPCRPVPVVGVQDPHETTQVDSPRRAGGGCSSAWPVNSSIGTGTTTSCRCIANRGAGPDLSRRLAEELAHAADRPRLQDQDHRRPGPSRPITRWSPGNAPRGRALAASWVAHPDRGHPHPRRPDASPTSSPPPPPRSPTRPTSRSISTAITGSTGPRWPRWRTGCSTAAGPWSRPRTRSAAISAWSRSITAPTTARWHQYLRERVLPMRNADRNAEPQECGTRNSEVGIRGPPTHQAAASQR